MLTFSQQLDKFTDKLTVRSKRTDSQISDSIYRNVRLFTPKDTGRARAGWFREKAVPVTVISNNVPYIWVLEHGHSSQAPYGMVKKAMATEVLKINKGFYNDK